MSEDEVRSLHAAEPREVLGVTASPHRPEARGFTPGPWHFHVSRTPDTDVDYVAVGSGRAEGNIYSHPDASDESVANARLIAAAPDLYEALRTVVGSAHQVSVPGHGGHLTMVGPVVTVHALDNARTVLARAKENDSNG